MKTVGKQLEEARLAKNWTPELASRETKIKVDRLRDLEADDYSHFASPTYARGFVRTYARALGLDEYRMLRQLDTKLPDDDSSNIATETGVAYLPETSMPPRAAHMDYTGLYIVMALGAVVTLAIMFVLFEAYRVGELSNWFASSTEPAAAAGTSGTNADGTPAIPAADAMKRALPVDSNTPPPIVDATTNEATATNTATATVDTNAAPTSPRALPVDLSTLATNVATADTNAAPVHAPRALPVDPSELTNAAAPVAPRALPVNPADLNNAAPAAPAPTTVVAMNTPQPSNGAAKIPIPPVATSAPTLRAPVPSASSATPQPHNGPVMEPPLPPVAPTASDATASTSADPNKRLVLTASQDSFVRVTNLDSPDADKPMYAAVLHSGESIGFNGRKFSINVGIPAAVGIKLDGVNYGPHSDQQAPETFTVESHLP